MPHYAASPQSYEPFVWAHSPNAELSGRTRTGGGCGVGVAGTGVAVAVGAAVGAVVGACPEVAVGVGVPVSCVGSVVVVADGVPAASTAAPALRVASGGLARVPTGIIEPGVIPGVRPAEASALSRSSPPPSPVITTATPRNASNASRPPAKSARDRETPGSFGRGGRSERIP